MGYLSSCNAESAISTCDSYNLSKKSLSNPHNKLYKLTKFPYTDLESATNAFSETNFLGKGSHGSVYRAVLHGGALIAAVKRTTSNPPPDRNNNNCCSSPAENEIETLSRVRNPRLVNLLGFGSHPIDGRKLLVVEYMPNGSLYDLIHTNTTQSQTLSLSKRVRIAVQVAKAIHYLHSCNPPVIHRDIKSSNILFDRKWNARLGDFGLALRGHVEDVKVQCTPPAGTLGYLDPCYLAPSDLTAKSDVFSFGILLLELFSGRNAIDLRFSPPSVVEWAVPIIKSGNYFALFDQNVDVLCDESVVRILALLAGRCVRSTVEKRPGMGEVVECLIAVSKRVKLSWNGFGRVRRCVKVTAPPIVEYKRAEGTEAVISSRKVRKGSGAVTGKGKGRSDGGGVGRLRSRSRLRSKSIGCVEEIECGPLDGSKDGVMSRSKSTGELRGYGGIVLEMIRNPNVRELESSKLLVRCG